MPRAIIYCRVSSDRQVREGHGLDGQELRCRKYAEYHGYEVTAVFRDEGVSGGVIDREGMQEMLNFLDTHPHSEECVVLIDDIKRLARDLIGHFTLRKAISARGARLESPSHRFGEEPEAVFVESIMAATAQLERDQNRKQVRNRMQARLEAGYWPFYPPPGYTFAKVTGHGKLIVPKEPEASVIREALEGFASGRFPTQVEVQRFLRERGFNHCGIGQGAYLEQVKRLLTREVYAGFICYPPWNVTRRKGHHQPLVSAETFDRVLERLNERAKQPQRKNLRCDFPLRGFVLCAVCGKPYTAAWSRGKRKTFGYYRCQTLGCGFVGKSVRADRMHAEFEDLLGKLKPRPALLEAFRAEFLSEWNRRQLDVETVRKERQRKLDGIQKELNGYLEAVGKCHNATMLKRIEEQVEALDARKLRLGGRIEKAKSYDFEHALDLVLDFLKNPRFMWQTGNLPQKQMVLRLVLTEPLVYDRQSGFGTPSFSLPINISCILELDRMEMVDMVRRTWNTLECFVRECAATIRGLSVAEKPRSAS